MPLKKSLTPVTTRPSRPFAGKAFGTTPQFAGLGISRTAFVAASGSIGRGFMPPSAVAAAGDSPVIPVWYRVVVSLPLLFSRQRVFSGRWPKLVRPDPAAHHDLQPE